jgi:hypothetical protein
MTYKQQLQTKEWKAKRLEILERDGHKCTVCESTEKLQVHHLYYRKTKKAWEYPNKALITLCRTCHEEEHPTLFDGEISVTMVYKFAGDSFRFITYIQALKKRQKSTSVFDFKIDHACNVLKITVTQLDTILQRFFNLGIIQKAGRGKLKSSL